MKHVHKKKIMFLLFLFNYITVYYHQFIFQNYLLICNNINIILFILLGTHILCYYKILQQSNLDSILLFIYRLNRQFVQNNIVNNNVIRLIVIRMRN